jgi:hypothetical protein
MGNLFSNTVGLTKARVSENRVLRIIFGFERDQTTGK